MYALKILRPNQIILHSCGCKNYILIEMGIFLFRVLSNFLQKYISKLTGFLRGKIILIRFLIVVTLFYFHMQEVRKKLWTELRFLSFADFSFFYYRFNLKTGTKCKIMKLIQHTTEIMSH